MNALLDFLLIYTVLAAGAWCLGFFGTPIAERYLRFMARRIGR